LLPERDVGAHTSSEGERQLANGAGTSLPKVKVSPFGFRHDVVALAEVASEDLEVEEVVAELLSSSAR
jgi:hypothetical protein